MARDGRFIGARWSLDLEMEHPPGVEAPLVDAALATGVLAEAASQDDAARAAGWAHMLERARAGGLGGEADGGAIPELVGAREQIIRMLQSRIEHADPSTQRRARDKLAQLQASAGGAGAENEVNMITSMQSILSSGAGNADAFAAIENGPGPGAG